METSYREIKGNLIDLALAGEFDVIAHGCNCFCTMDAGIAVQMAKTFGCDKFIPESDDFKGDINKLGHIDFQERNINSPKTRGYSFKKGENLYVVNAYTQYMYGRNHIDGDIEPLDYDALTLCLRKMNHIFKGKHIGLPQIGCGLAGGYWHIVQEIIKEELVDCNVTVVIYG